MRTLMISPDVTLLDDESVRRTPADTWNGLGALLSRVSRLMDGEGLVLVDDPAARALKLPLGPDDPAVGLDDARAAGWKVKDPGPWMSFHADRRPTVHVGILPLIDPRRAPVIVPYWPQSSVTTAALWHQLAGVAWRGTPGVVGMVMMRQHAPQLEVRGRPAPLAWKPRDIGPDGAYESAYELDHFDRPAEHEFEHGYDFRRAYLNGMGTCELLAPWTLRHTGRVKYDARRSMAGWFKAEMAPWNEPRLPHPAGPGPLVRWVTAPTLALLHELTEAGVYGGFEIIDSWTGTAKRLFRGWAGAIDSTYLTATEMAQERDEIGPTARAQDATMVATAAKLVYKEAWGLLNAPSNFAYRPDWHYATLAQGRCALWRRMWAAARAGRWPLRIDVDHVFYDSTEPDPHRAAPPGFVLGDRLGQFSIKPGGTK